jgi:hypothetical protein
MLREMTCQTTIDYEYPRMMVFITPTLPGITDVDGMIEALPEKVPILLDTVRLGPENASTPRFFEFVK